MKVSFSSFGGPTTNNVSIGVFRVKIIFASGEVGSFKVVIEDSSRPQLELLVARPLDLRVTRSHIISVRRTNNTVVVQIATRDIYEGRAHGTDTKTAITSKKTIVTDTLVLGATITMSTTCVSCKEKGIQAVKKLRKRSNGKMSKPSVTYGIQH